MGALSGEELPVALAAGAELVAWDSAFVEDLERLIRRRGSQPGPLGIHVKLDSGMGRLGTRDAGRALAVARAVLDRAPALRLAGVMTHFATADSDPDFLAAQLAVFGPFVEAVRALAGGEPLLVHAANSAATLLAPESHFDLVRPGIAIYGGDPAGRDPAVHGLEPALAWRSYVAAVKAITPGESAGYGRRFIAERPSHLATIPVGYGDGYSRGLTNRGTVLIGGRRYPVVGAVSMDNLTVEVGPEPVVAVGDTVTLLGDDGDERIASEAIAQELDTINYEVLCRISRRVPRHYHRDGTPV
jgi:alanine racemase